MAAITIVQLEPSYLRPAPNNLQVYDQAAFIRYLEYKPETFSIIKIRPHGFGGNHSHSRIESFYAFGGTLELIYLEGTASKSLILNPEDAEQIVTIQPNIPHAIVNRSASQQGLLLEWGDKPMSDRREVQVYSHQG